MKRTIVILEKGRERRITLKELEQRTSRDLINTPTILSDRDRQIRTRKNG
jgi:hypothetical protein